MVVLVSVVESIWDWFEEKFDISVAKDLMHV